MNNEIIVTQNLTTIYANITEADARRAGCIIIDMPQYDRDDPRHLEELRRIVPSAMGALWLDSYPQGRGLIYVGRRFPRTERGEQRYICATLRDCKSAS